MEQKIFEITENRSLASGIWRMRLSGDASAVTRPGQFVNLSLPGYFLRRPISVHDWEDGAITLIYKVLGSGTADMTRLAPGTKLDVLTGLGNGYDLTRAGDAPLLVGGGVGIPPLYWLAKELIKLNKPVTAVLGFNRADEIFCLEEFAALGAKVALATVDGSRGVRGFVTDALPEDYSCVYACGPLPMLRAVDRATRGPLQMSFEERMGCGFGACMGCTIQTKNGGKRVCADGPVLEREEILWDALR